MKCLAPSKHLAYLWVAEDNNCFQCLFPTGLSGLPNSSTKEVEQILPSSFDAWGSRKWSSLATCLGSLEVHSAVSSFVFLCARAAWCGNGPGCRSGLCCSSCSGCCMSGGPRGGGVPGSSQCTYELLPLEGMVSTSGGSFTLHPLLGWDPWQLGRRSFSFCLLIMYFLRLAPQTCGLTWDCTQLCGSPLSESSGLWAMGLMRRDRKNSSSIAVGWRPCAHVPLLPLGGTRRLHTASTGRLAESQATGRGLSAAVHFLWMCGWSGD